MNWNSTLQVVLTVLVAAGLRFLFTLINVEVDEGTFNAIVAGIVIWLLAQIGVDVARARGVRGIL